MPSFHLLSCIVLSAAYGCDLVSMKQSGADKRASDVTGRAEYDPMRLLRRIVISRRVAARGQLQLRTLACHAGTGCYNKVGYSKA